MIPIPAEHKRIITLFITDNLYRNFMPDCWGRVEIEGTKPTDYGTGLTYLVAGYDTVSKERLYFDTVLSASKFGPDIVWMHEAKPVVYGNLK